MDTQIYLMGKEEARGRVLEWCRQSFLSLSTILRHVRQQEGHDLSHREAHNHYVAWCQQQKIEPTMRAIFGRMLREVFGEIKPRSASQAAGSQGQQYNVLPQLVLLSHVHGYGGRWAMIAAQTDGKAGAAVLAACFVCRAWCSHLLPHDNCDCDGDAVSTTSPKHQAAACQTQSQRDAVHEIVTTAAPLYTSWLARWSGLPLLQWAKANRCPWNDHTCSEAAASGSLQTIRWAMANGCPANVDVCTCAAGGGHLPMLQWAKASGCPWDTHACAQAAAGGHLEVLQWLR